MREAQNIANGVFQIAPFGNIPFTKIRFASRQFYMISGFKNIFTQCEWQNRFPEIYDIK